jgi:hypothetical protein
MLPFQSLKLDVKRAFSITPSFIFLLIIMQLVAWYPFLDKAYDDVVYQNKLKNRAIKNWLKTSYQAKKLESATFITDQWVTHQVIASKEGIPTRWVIEGSASLAAWQSLLEYIKEQVALSLSSVTWHNRLNGTWFGRLSFVVIAPRKNLPMAGWLPIHSRSHHFVENEWRLLSIMRTEYTSALLQHNEAKFWVKVGDWLPEIGMTVSRVEFNQIALMATNGQTIRLGTAEKGSGNDALY